ncbi:hypothetical protein LXL04_030001 [Taraxacum kok-saghyz]
MPTRKNAIFSESMWNTLGHIVPQGGVYANLPKTTPMFVKGYGQVAWPLTEQLKKYRSSLNESGTTAFRKLQVAMTRLLVLTLPDFEKAFEVETDAS